MLLSILENVTRKGQNNVTTILAAGYQRNLPNKGMLIVTGSASTCRFSPEESDNICLLPSLLQYLC